MTCGVEGSGDRGGSADARQHGIAADHGMGADPQTGRRAAIRLRDQGERGGTVAEAGRGPGRQGAAREQGGQARERRGGAAQGIVRTDLRHRHQLGVETAGTGGGAGAGVAAGGMSVLAVPVDAVGDGEVLGGARHLRIRPARRGERSAGVGHAIEAPLRRGRGALHAPGEAGPQVAGLDRAGGVDHGRQSAAALAVHGRPRHLHSEPGGERCDPGRVAAGAQAVAEHHIGDLERGVRCGIGRGGGALESGGGIGEGSAEHGSGELLDRELGEAATAGPDRGAPGRDDDGAVSHSARPPRRADGAAPRREPASPMRCGAGSRGTRAGADARG